ncbi:MAG: sulfotransferase [Chthoniobacteraceae bacterium]
MNTINSDVHLSTREAVPVCIAGMHRSGTSMFTGLLGNAGVYVGENQDFLPEHTGDNPGGLQEHFGFHALNEMLLIHLGGGWDMPGLPENWVSRKDIEPFREKGRLLIDRMRASSEGRIAWAWKDPRNSLTVQFWSGLLPELRVVMCVRNPLDVALSLQCRNGFSQAAACRLWLDYYRNLLDNVPEHARVLTFYENYFTDPVAELKRVLQKLGLAVDETVIASTCALADPALHHHQSTIEQLLASDCGLEVIAMYSRLREEAEANAGKPVTGVNAVAVAAEIETTGADLVRSRFHVETAQREEHIRHLANENALLRKSLEDLVEKVAGLTSEMEAERNRREAQTRKLSIIAEKAVAVHGLVAHKTAQFAFLQAKVESTLKETNQMLPRVIRCSNTINSVWRIFKRIRKLGKLLKLQREINNATNESTGTLTHIASVMANNGVETDIAHAGLVGYDSEKTPMDVAQLMELLRIRLS